MIRRLIGDASIPSLQVSKRTISDPLNTLRFENSPNLGIPSE